MSAKSFSYNEAEKEELTESLFRESQQGLANHRGWSGGRPRNRLRGALRSSDADAETSTEAESEADAEEDAGGDAEADEEPDTGTDVRRGRGRLAGKSRLALVWS